jgi:hypothetical protein
MLTVVLRIDILSLFCGSYRTGLIFSQEYVDVPAQPLLPLPVFPCRMIGRQAGMQACSVTHSAETIATWSRGDEQSPLSSLFLLRGDTGRQAGRQDKRESIHGVSAFLRR